MKHPSPADFWKKLGLQLLGVVVIFFVLGFAVWKVYRVVSVREMVSQARGYFQKGDIRNASIVGQRAYEFDPGGREITVLMAEMFDSVQSPESVRWWERVAELSPGSAQESMRWADAAIRYRNFEAAERAIKAVPAAAQATAEFAIKRGMILIGRGKFMEADAAFQEAVRRDPRNPAGRYNAATSILRMQDNARIPAAVADLESLSKEIGAMQVPALRSLASHAMLENNWNRALASTSRIAELGKGNADDGVIHLDMLDKTGQRAAVMAYLPVAEALCKTPGQVAGLLKWMGDHGLTKEAIAWFDRMDPAFAKTGEVGVLAAENMVVEKLWDRLLTLAGNESADWGAVEFLRYAYHCRALREKREKIAADGRWSVARSKATRAPSSAQILALLALKWGWTEECRDLLWSAAELPKGDWAMEQLHRMYRYERDTSGLLKVAEAALRKDPKDPRARNNVALLSLLTDRDREHALKTTTALIAEFPKETGVITTHALALHLTGRNDEACSLLDTIPREIAHRKDVALYRGIILSANPTRVEAALDALAAAIEAPKLKEEEELWMAARAKLSGGGPFTDLKSALNGGK
jgi:thioredoxin-like negative regulator of GroEL